MVTFAVARGGPAEPTAGSSFHPAFDKATPFPDKGLTIDGRVAPAVTILARYAGWGYRKPRFHGIIDTERTHRSAKAFRFGLRGGSCRHFTPPAAKLSRNSAQNLLSRSWST